MQRSSRSRASARGRRTSTFSSASAIRTPGPLAISPCRRRRGWRSDCGRGLIRRGGFCTAAVLAFCLAISAAYELIEFGAAKAMGQGADAFLGTQGDPWDTQWDMLTCLIGAAVALPLLSRIDDRLIDARRA